VSVAVEDGSLASCCGSLASCGAGRISCGASDGAALGDGDGGMMCGGEHVMELETLSLSESSSSGSGSMRTGGSVKVGRSGDEWKTLSMSLIWTGMD